MSEATQFSSTSDLKRWLESQTNATLTPVHAQAKKLRDDMNMAVQGIVEVTTSILDNTSKEIEKRNMRVYNRARAFNKLAHLFIDRLKKLSPPDSITYESLNKYNQETQKVFLVTDIDVKNWFPRISPFFIMDRRKFLAVYERAKQSFSVLNDFVTKEYVKTKTLEETFQLLGELQNYEKQLTLILEEKENVKNERLPIEKEIAELEQKIDELKSKGPIDKLNLVNTEIDALNTELKHELRHLQKPFIKVQALATQGGGAGLTLDELNKMNQYMEKPFEALVTEQNGYPMLKTILQKLENLMSQDKLKLKPDKARKAEQSINNILKQDSLAKPQIRCAEMNMTKEQLITSEKLDEIKRNLSMFQEQTEQLKARKTSVETHETVKENQYKETLEKIGSIKRSIERNILSSLLLRVQIA